MDRVFDAIPEAQIERENWAQNFKSLGDRGRETTWGLLDVDRRVLGLCVMLEESLARETKLYKDADLAEDIVQTSHNKIKGLQMELGRARKTIARLQAPLVESQSEAPAESESA